MDERTILQKCMTEARKRLDYYRENGDDLQADLAEADINLMLERWNDLPPET